MKRLLPKFLLLLVIFFLPRSVSAQTAPTPTPTAGWSSGTCAEIARAGGYNEYGCISNPDVVTLGCGNPEDPERQDKCFFDFHSTSSDDCTGATPLCGYLKSIRCIDSNTGKCEQNICSTTAGCTLPTSTPTPTAAPCAAECQTLLDLIDDIVSQAGGQVVRCGQSGYNQVADVNKDGKIDIGDRIAVQTHCNDSTWCTNKLHDQTNPCATTPTPTSTPALVCTLDTCYGSCAGCRTNCHRDCTLLTGEDAQRICGSGWTRGYQCCNVGGAPCPTSPPQPTNTPRATGTPASCSCSSGLPKSRGNANCDGFINQLDFNLWLQQFHSTPDPNPMRSADFNCDNKVDGIDFEYWRRGKP